MKKSRAVFVEVKDAKPSIILVEGKKIKPTPKDYNNLVKNIGKLIRQYRKIIKKDKKKPGIDIRKVAKGLGAEIITDPAKIAEMKKKKYPWHPE